MTAARIVVFAYSDVGHACLQLLLARGANVVAVYTHADAPGERLWFPSVAGLARARGIPVHLDAELSRPEALDALRAHAPELILSCYYRALLPAAVLALPRLGAFNLHGSLLPRYRGRAPVNWAVLRGERETGATLHVMTTRADAGDIVDQEAVAIGPDDSAAEVQARVTTAAVRVLDRQLPALLRGDAPRRPQDHGAATTFGRRRPEDGAFDWSRPAREIHDLVRAVTHPYPGARATLAGHPLLVWRTRVHEGVLVEAPPGTVRTAGDRLLVACGDGRWLEILRAQIAGDTERDGAELARRLATTDTPTPTGP
ncbi:MAG TPA: formyltransferase [Gemmatimonadaceae bacterium]|nr:formyltransferase [Gemmatimonadaceae bacterium]